LPCRPLRIAIVKIDEHRSVTIGGDEHPCAIWRKR
jgi:hypothetical protein